MWVNPLYLPEHPRAAAKRIVDRNPLATITSYPDAQMAHMPMLWREGSAGSEVVVGHMPLVDPIARQIAQGTQLLIAFQGDAAYVSPEWYRENGLPTYNYSIVHVRGAARQLNESQLRAHLHDLIMHEETLLHATEGECWRPDEAAEERLEMLLPRILGFEVALDDVDVKTKLGQNRSAEDNDGVIRSLLASDSSRDRGVAEQMRADRNVPKSV